MRARTQSRVWLLACLVAAQPVLAEETPVLGLEFLEYLGSLVEEDGKWMGPEEMEQLAVEDKSQKVNEENSPEAEETP